MSWKARHERLRSLLDKMTIRQKALLCSGQDFWTTESLPHLGISGIRMADGPCGLRLEEDDSTILPSICYPSPSALGCSFDYQLTREVGAAIASEAREAGISLLLAPALNIKRFPLGGRNFEYYSEDPLLSGELAAAMVNGIQSQGVGACLKHFAVNNQEYCRYTIDARLDKRTLHEMYLEAFRIAINKSQPLAVMSSYNRVNGEYVGESSYLLSEVLRKRFRFDGLVMSDWGAVCDRVAALQAGLDLEMPGKTSGTTETILSALNTQGLTQQALDTAVLRIVDLMIRCRELRSGTYVRYTDETAHTLAHRAACESAVLLKNERNILPFRDDKPLAVIGLGAMQPYIQGSGSSKVNPKHIVNVPTALDARGARYVCADGYNADGSTNDLLVGEAKKIAIETGRAIIFCGFPENTESEGYDRSSFSLPEGILKLIDIIASVCADTVVYLMTGSPVALPFLGQVKAILWGNLAGQASAQAAVDLLLGRAEPAGRLAESWPIRLSDLPAAQTFGKNKRNAEYREGIYIGYRYFTAAKKEPLFPFGYGLSYTTFEYDRISCNRNTLGAREQAVVSVRVRNAGDRPGFSVVQLYSSRKDDSMRKLVAFEKVYLYAGESSVVRLRVNADSFSYHHTHLDTRCIEMGEYTLSVGYSSADIAGTCMLTVYPDDNTEMADYPGVNEINHFTDKEFQQLIRYTPCEIPTRPYTLNSTIGELKIRTIGKIVRSSAENFIRQDSSETAEMALRTLDDTPLRILCANSRGTLNKSLAESIVYLANHEILRGIIVGLKK